MNTAEYAKMADRERTYWWHVGRLSIINTWILKWIKLNNKTRILNVGCGTGGTIKMLEKYGAVDNVDISSEAIKFMQINGYRVNKVKNHKLPYEDSSFDLVVAFDVLEHIKDHENAVEEWSRVLKKGGAILFTVPAYQWLWSDHDISLHHYRRYNKKLIKKIIPKNTSLSRISYFIVFSLPLIIVFRFVSKLLERKVDSETSYVKVPKVINWFFTKLLEVESELHKYITFPAGTSLIAIIRKI